MQGCSHMFTSVAPPTFDIKNCRGHDGGGLRLLVLYHMYFTPI